MPPGIYLADAGVIPPSTRNIRAAFARPMRGVLTTE